MSNKAKYPIVVLVDDSEIDNFINKKIIMDNNFAENVYVFRNSIGALDYLKNIEQDKNLSSESIPCIIFLDINIPIIDGFQFLQMFEQLGDKIKTHCKIVMLTTSLNPADEKACKKNKFVIKYIHKPLTNEHFKKF